MVRLILFVFFSSIAVSANSMEVSCTSDEIYFKDADVVFEGRVTNRKSVEDQAPDSICWSSKRNKKCGSKIATFKVDKINKGSPEENVTVYAGDGCYCVDPYLDHGKKYIVFAKKDGKRADYYSLNACATKGIGVNAK